MVIALDNPVTTLATLPDGSGAGGSAALVLSDPNWN